MVLGELSLDGAVNGIRGVLPIAVAARRLGLTRMLLPPQNAAEACVVEGLDVGNGGSVGAAPQRVLVVLDDIEIETHHLAHCVQDGRDLTVALSGMQQRLASHAHLP